MWGSLPASPPHTMHNPEHTPERPDDFEMLFTVPQLDTLEKVERFAELDFSGCGFESLQAYFSQLFDLWEADLAIHCDAPAPASEAEVERIFEKLKEQRWAVDDYANRKGWNLDRDAVHSPSVNLEWRRLCP
jgi:hypothetical protein